MNPSQYNLSFTNLNHILPKLSDASFMHPEKCTEPRIKRPMNSFMIWSSKRRKEISHEFPQMQNSEISKILGKEWKIVPQKTKDTYKLKAKELKIKHYKNYPNYKYKPQRKRKKESSFVDYNPMIYLTENKFSFHSPIPNVIPHPYTGYPNNYAPYIFGHGAGDIQFDATTTAPFMNHKNNTAYLPSTFANTNLLYPNYHTPSSSMSVASPMMGRGNVLHSTFPSTFDKKYENNNVYSNCVIPQNSLQLIPSYNQPTRTPLSEYNQQ